MKNWEKALQGNVSSRGTLSTEMRLLELVLQGMAGLSTAELSRLQAFASDEGDTFAEQFFGSLIGNVNAASVGLDAIPSSQKGTVNGVATLDGAGRVPSSQLTIDAMEFKGAWNASTNSPALADGTGSAGDMYRVSVAGTQNLGSGSTSYLVGDSLVYSGAVWQRYQVQNALDILKDGSVPYSANQPMGGNKLTGLSAGTTAGDSVRYEQAILTSGANAFGAAQSFGGFKAINVADPTAAQDAATKNYTDTQIAALQTMLQALPADQKRYVSKAGNDSTGNGSFLKPFLTVAAALASITDATSNKIYQIIIAPGTYLEVNTIALKAWVFLKGLASRNTGITSSPIFQEIVTIGRTDGNAIPMTFVSGAAVVQCDDLCFGTGLNVTVAAGASANHAFNLNNCQVIQGLDYTLNALGAVQALQYNSYNTQYLAGTFTPSATLVLNAVRATFVNDQINTSAFVVASGPGSGSINVGSTNSNALTTASFVTIINSQFARLQVTGSVTASMYNNQSLSGDFLGIDGTTAVVRTNVDGYPRSFASTDLTGGAVATQLVLQSNILGRGNTLSLGNFASGGSIGQIDGNTVINIAQTTAGQTLSIPSPIDTARAMTAYVVNTGTTSFTMGSFTVTNGTAIEAIWNGTSWFFK